MFCGGNYPELKIKTENLNGKNLLIIKDSFANEFLPFLVNDYENICVIDLRYFKNDINNYINSNNINEILFLYNIDSFSEDSNLKSLI